MRLTFQKADLLNGINIVMKAVPSKTNLPILECILIDARSDQIKFTANDMELGIETVVEGEILEKGMIALDAKIFSDISRKFSDSTVMIETDSSFTANISCEKTNYKIPGKDGEDFVKMPAVEENAQIEISQYSLKEIIKQTIFSISTGEANKLMTGELFEISGNMLKVVSLDGYRISIRNMELKASCPAQRVVVPGKTLSEISKILTGETEDMVQISFSENHIIFRFDETKVVSRLIDGEYYKIEQMLSGDYESKVLANRAEFLTCIDSAMPLIRESDRVPVILHIKDSEMVLQNESAIGSMKAEMPIDKTGKDITIGFNPKFLMDALRVIDDETVSLYFVNAKAPCFIRDDEGKYIYLILPVNINV